MAFLGGSTEADPYLWLEDVGGDEALAWVGERNDATRDALAEDPAFDPLQRRLLEIFDADDRIPHVYKAGDWYYNLWKDEANPRGLWRRTTLEEYRKPDPAWEVVLDIDALGRDEGENWVYGGASILVPTYDRCLLRLSRGGADAVVVREFDLVARAFVEDGFSLPESKGSAAWAGPNEIFVATDFGAGTMTDSGYPRIVKLWRRGEPLEEATTVFEGESSDVSVGAYAELSPGFEMQFVYRGRDFYNSDHFIRRGEQLIPLEIPSDAGYAVHRGRLYVTTRSDWSTEASTFATGSLIALELDRFVAGGRGFAVLFEPGEGTRALRLLPDPQPRSHQHPGQRAQPHRSRDSRPRRLDHRPASGRRPRRVPDPQGRRRGPRRRRPFLPHHHRLPDPVHPGPCVGG